MPKSHLDDVHTTSEMVEDAITESLERSRRVDELGAQIAELTKTVRATARATEQWLGAKR